MIPAAAAAAAAALLAGAAGAAHAEAAIPDWVRQGAGWWAEGRTSDADFLSAMQYLAGTGVLEIPPAAGAPGEAAAGEGIPGWVRQGAGWWAEGRTSDADFLSAMQYLAGIGVLEIPPAAGAPGEARPAAGSRMAELEAELAACEGIARAAERSDCRRDAEEAIARQGYLDGAEPHVVGPVTFYYPGAELEFSGSGQALLGVRMLAENTGGGGNVALSCTGPAICAYDVWDGSSAFKYSGSDFTSGQIVLKPGASREFELLFGPNIGYGGTQFLYDPAKEYHFRIQEPWGSAQIPLGVSGRGG